MTQATILARQIQMKIYSEFWRDKYKWKFILNFGAILVIKGQRTLLRYVIYQP